MCEDERHRSTPSEKKALLWRQQSLAAKGPRVWPKPMLYQHYKWFTGEESKAREAGTRERVIQRTNPMEQVISAQGILKCS